MITISFGLLGLAATIISPSCEQGIPNKAENMKPLYNTTVDQVVPLPSASPPLLSHLNRRIAIDNSCDEETVELLTRLMPRIEVVSRRAMQGAALRTTHRGSGRGGGGGRGRGRGGAQHAQRDTFAENAFRRHFSINPARPQPMPEISLSLRSYVRRRFLLVAEQASRTRRPGDRDFRADQVYHCEREGDPGGVCRSGGHIKVVYDRPHWNVIVSHRLPSSISVHDSKVKEYEKPLRYEKHVLNQRFSVHSALDFTPFPSFRPQLRL